MATFEISFPTISRKVLIRSFWFLVGFLSLAGFTAIQAKLYLIPGFQEILDLGDGYHIEHARLMWVPVIGYLLIAGSLLLAASIFMKLRKFKESGLVTFLVLGFVISFFLWFVLYFGTAGGFSGFTMAISFLIGHTGSLCQVYK